jgi:hypothetical protein
MWTYRSKALKTFISAGILCALGGLAHAQQSFPTTNKDGSIGTVSGAVTMCVDATSHLASPCTSSGGGGGGGSVTQGTSPWVENVSQIGGATYGLGHQLMVASAPVTIASDQSPFGVLAGLVSAANPTLTAGASVQESITTFGAARVTLLSSVGAAMDLSPTSGGGARPLSVASYNATAIACGSGGSCPVAQNSAAELYADPEIQKATYVASVNVSPAASGIFAQLCGSASKIIRIRTESLDGTATTAGGAVFSAIKTTSAATGGTTGGTVSLGPVDSASAAASATMKAWTAAPTDGTEVFTYETMSQPLPLIASAVPPVVLTHGQGAQSIVLRGAAQCASYSWPTLAASTAGMNMTMTVTWTEE